MESKKTQMTAAGLLTFHEELCAKAHALCAAKNHDYAGAEGLSPFRNFESIEALGVAKTEVGFLVRMIDKINRLCTFIKDGKLTVENEGAEDALLDLINYCVLLGAYIKKNTTHDYRTGY